MNDHAKHLPGDDPEETPEETSDAAFLSRLQSLSPAPISDDRKSDDRKSDAGKTGKALSMESMLYQAGYRAGRESSVVRGERSRWIQGMMPALAASLLTALLSLPIAYQAGHYQASRYQSGPDEADSNEASPTRARPGEAGGETRHTGRPSAEGEQDANQNETPSQPMEAGTLAADRSPSRVDSDSRRDETESLSAKSAPWDLWKGLVSRETPSGTPTAFRITSLDELPRSSWLALSDEPQVERKMFSAGDFDSVTLGLQVNQR